MGSEVLVCVSAGFLFIGVRFKGWSSFFHDGIQSFSPVLAGVAECLGVGFSLECFFQSSVLLLSECLDHGSDGQGVLCRNLLGQQESDVFRQFVDNAQLQRFLSAEGFSRQQYFVDLGGRA